MGGMSSLPRAWPNQTIHSTTPALSESSPARDVSLPGHCLLPAWHLKFFLGLLSTLRPGEHHPEEHHLYSTLELHRPSSPFSLTFSGVFNLLCTPHEARSAESCPDIAFSLVKLLSTSLLCSSLPSYWSGSCPQVSHFHPCLLIGWALVLKSTMLFLVFTHLRWCFFEESWSW